MTLPVRSLAIVAAAACLGGPTVAGQARDASQGRDAGQVLAAAREALGGDKNLAAVRTFVASGRTRQLRGNNLVPIEVEMTCELPDKFVRKDEFPAQDTDLTVSGFRGEELILFPQPAAGRGGPPAAQRLATVKQDFARLALGAFAASFPAYPLTFKYAAEGEAPEGKADILDVAGPANFAARFVVQRETHLPVMLMWQGPTPPGRAGAPPPDGASASSSESRMYYADYRAVSGVKWPFRIRRSVGGATIEETTFDRVSVNVKIDPKKFEAPR